MTTDRPRHTLKACLQKAAEYEHLASKVRIPLYRQRYLELASGWRDLAAAMQAGEETPDA
ncbi:hypothetical protein LRS10_22110 [Phenylobacterium sp. J426]|uniref:hypothetical protein n=1 Tax=Phenylobacterium sp. J426 TaxID=2898439 RepID=UPI002151A2B7|nr:hypothetical protein [Phenylobacterium sp. J426]MCR5876605.1 hypothetical protein [Phenylobacterium sp. J426]